MAGSGLLGPGLAGGDGLELLEMVLQVVRGHGRELREAPPADLVVRALARLTGQDAAHTVAAGQTFPQRPQFARSDASATHLSLVEQPVKVTRIV